jgi:hypothetical protein
MTPRPASTRLGWDVRASPADTHQDDTPDVRFAYDFLLDNPEPVIDKAEWPEDMPAEPNDELIGTYYCSACNCIEGAIPALSETTYRKVISEDASKWW